MRERPAFSVPVSDLEWGDKHVDWSVDAAWLSHALEGTEARPRGQEAGRLKLVLSKNGREVMVRGKLQAPLEMDDARTLEPVPVDVQTDVFLLLSPAETPVLAEVDRARQARKGATGVGRKGASAVGAASSANPATAAAKHKKKRAAEQEQTEHLSLEDASRDVYRGDEITLDPFVREFLLLELPLFPLREPDSPAIAPPPPGPAGTLSGAEEPRRIDPRLAPLAALAERLGQQASVSTPEQGSTRDDEAPEDG